MFSRKIKGQWFLLIVTLFIAQACFATAPSYDELAGCTISDTDAGGTIDGEEDVELEEAGETIELTGTIEESDGGWILRTNSGQTYPITEDSKIPKEKEGTFFAVTVLVPQSEGWTTAIKFVEKKNAFVEGVGRFLSNLFTMQNSLPDRRPQEWKLPKAVEKEGKDFLAAYANYVKAAHKTLRESYAKKAIETCSSCKSPYNVLTQLNRATYGTNKKTYDEAMSKLATYVKALVSKGVLSKVDSKVTYIAVDKVAFLVAVVDKKTDEALYIVPIAYGAHPSGAPKEANGDLKSPNVTDSGKLAAGRHSLFHRPTLWRHNRQRNDRTLHGPFIE